MRHDISFVRIRIRIRHTLTLINQANKQVFYLNNHTKTHSPVRTLSHYEHWAAFASPREKPPAPAATTKAALQSARKNPN